jgi:hypothetical protein
MQSKNIEYVVDSSLLPAAMAVAYDNWQRWRRIFEDDGYAVLSDPSLFDIFCQKYGVGRTIQAGKRDEFRLRLLERMPQEIQDVSGKGIDHLDQSCRGEFGIQGARSLRSVISKVAAFLSPDQFMAWDIFARRGLLRISPPPHTGQCPCYAAYLHCLKKAFENGLKTPIQSAISKEKIVCTPNSTAFALRVMDVCLMISGGRERLREVQLLRERVSCAKRYTLEVRAHRKS